MRQAVESLLASWQHEAGAARRMDAERLARLNRHLALDLAEAWHNSQCLFVVGKDELELVQRRLRLSGSAGPVIGVVCLDETDEMVALVRLRDHPVLGPLLREGYQERAVDLSQTDGGEGEEDDGD